MRQRAFTSERHLQFDAIGTEKQNTLKNMLITMVGGSVTFGGKKTKKTFGLIQKYVFSL